MGLKGKRKVSGKIFKINGWLRSQLALRAIWTVMELLALRAIWTAMELLALRAIWTAMELFSSKNGKAGTTRRECFSGGWPQSGSLCRAAVLQVLLLVQ